QIAQRLRATAYQNSDPGLLAYHYRMAEAWPDVLEYAWRAGLHAQAIYASDIALGHYRQALEAVDRLDQSARQQRPAILRRIGDLHALAGRYTDAVASYADALAAATETLEQANILIGWAEVCEQQAIYDDALMLLDRAAGLLPPEDTHLGLRIAVRRGWVLIRQGAARQDRAPAEPFLGRLDAWHALGGIPF